MAQCGYVGCKAHCHGESSYCVSHERMMARQERQDEPPVRHPQNEPAAREESGPDPLMVAGAIQQILLKQEVNDRLRASRARQKLRDSDGYELKESPKKALPFKVVPRRRSADSTIPTDPATGQPPASLRPDWVQRWVRTRDHMDRPTQARVAEFDEYGFEAVRNSDNSVCESRFGVLMQGPPEQAALRSAEKTPKGAAMRDTALEYALDLADSVNRVVGTDVANVFVDPEHRSERVVYTSGREPGEE